MEDLLTKAKILTESLPWIKSTWGKTVVIKYGGAAMADPALREKVASDIVLMKLVGINPGHRPRRRAGHHHVHGQARHAGRVPRWPPHHHR